MCDASGRRVRIDELPTDNIYDDFDHEALAKDLAEVRARFPPADVISVSLSGLVEQDKFTPVIMVVFSHVGLKHLETKLPMQIKLTDGSTVGMIYETPARVGL
jgi:hypothetical protein